MQTGAPLYNKDKISLIAKKPPKKTALPTWKNVDGWTLNKQFFLFGLKDVPINSHHKVVSLRRLSVQGLSSVEVPRPNPLALLQINCMRFIVVSIPNEGSPFHNFCE